MTVTLIQTANIHFPLSLTSQSPELGSKPTCDILCVSAFWQQKRKMKSPQPKMMFSCDVQNSRDQPCKEEKNSREERTWLCPKGTDLGSVIFLCYCEHIEGNNHFPHGCLHEGDNVYKVLGTAPNTQQVIYCYHYHYYL